MIWSSGEVPPSGQKPRDLEVRPGDMPKVLIIVITIVGTSLLVLNVALIACFVRRRHRKRLAKGLSHLQAIRFIYNHHTTTSSFDNQRAKTSVKQLAVEFSLINKKTRQKGPPSSNTPDDDESNQKEPKVRGLRLTAPRVREILNAFHFLLITRVLDLCN